VARTYGNSPPPRARAGLFGYIFMATLGKAGAAEVGSTRDRSMARYEQSMARYEQHTLSHPDAEFANAVGHGDHRPTPRSYASSHRPQGRTNCRSPRARPASDRSLVLALLGPVAMRVKAATPVVPGVVASVTGGDDAPSQL